VSDIDGEKEDEGPRKKERFGKYVVPEERANNIVKLLDEFLRKGPRKGLKYSRWQQIAWYEIVDELKRAEAAQKNQDSLTKASFLGLAVGFGTIGFWGIVVLLGQNFGMIGGVLIVIAGLVIWRSLAKGKWFS
tara:strand:- start:9127 stop:9525 length:399 start_codon:yes stop_codon:yes gene_type:complete